MSFLDNIEQEVEGAAGAQSGAAPGVLGQVMSLVNNPETGGLDGFVQKLHSNGMGDLVSSWVGGGANQPVSGDQIAQVLGQDKLNEIASNLGVQPDQIGGLIAQHLPGVIGKLTGQSQ
jgi:uncharacterized protein YidB (DUF937 family)